MRYSILLSYDGSQHCGWQVQKNAQSIQGDIQDALSMLLKTEITITGTGRTDTYVNATNYIAHFDAPSDLEIDTDKLIYKLNAILHKNIVIHNINLTNNDFHARFDAKSREYHYFIHRRKDIFADSHSYYCRYPLDIQKMNEAAAYILGEHDFSCFEKLGGGNATSICNVFQSEWAVYRPTHSQLMNAPYSEGDYIVFKVKANRFLRNMVRAIVGSLLEVGRGKKEPEWIKELIASKDRCSAGESVPGKALFFSRVDY